jgi:hypothetical protein
MRDGDKENVRAPALRSFGVIPPSYASSHAAMGSLEKIVKLACKPKAAPPKSKVRS